MQVGIVSRSFSGMTNRQTAVRMRELGYSSTELCFTALDSNYWHYNGLTDLSGLSLDRFLQIVRTYREEGILVHSLGCFTRCVEHDPEQRKLYIDCLRRFAEYAAWAGIPVIATECGFDPGCRSLRAAYYEEDYRLLTDTIRQAAEYAAQLGVSIAIEPCVLDVLPSARRMRHFLDELGLPNVGCMLDPANLIANSSEEDMFRDLEGRILYFHGKDRKINDAYGRLIGDGEIDWPKFLRLYHDKCEGIPFILEYANNETAEEAFRRVQAFDRQAAQL